MLRVRVFNKRLLPGLLLLLILSVAVPAGAKPELKIEASPKELSLGQTLNLNLTLTQEANEKGAMLDTPQLSLPQLPGLEILGQQTSSSMISNGSRMRMTSQAQYRLRPLKSGEIVIPSLTFQYSENGRNQELVTQPVTINVKGSSSGSVPWLFGGGMVLLGAGVAAFWLWRKKQISATVSEAPVSENQPVVAPVAVKKPAAKSAATPIDGFEARLNRGEEPQVLLEEIYDWFRELALKRQWSAGTSETHQEILNTLRYATGLPKTRVQAIEDFLRACDQMRFANHDVEPERLRQLLELARQFYNS